MCLNNHCRSAGGVGNSKDLRLTLRIEVNDKIPLILNSYLLKICISINRCTVISETFFDFADNAIATSTKVSIYILDQK